MKNRYADERILTVAGADILLSKTNFFASLRRRKKTMNLSCKHELNLLTYC